MKTFKFFARYLVIILVIISALFISVYAQGNEKLSDKQLEEMYWGCERAASSSFLSSAEAAFCSAVFEQLKQQKFGADFSKFYSWWQQNRTVQQKAEK